METNDQATLLPCACTALRKSGRAISRLYDDALAPTGLNVSQYALLATLDRTGPRSLTALAADLVMDRSTLSRNLAPLQRMHLVEIETGDDRRSRIVRNTPEGSSKLNDARPFWASAQRHVTSAFGHTRLELLLGELAEFRTAIS